jgi:hypothetical protein
MEPIAALDQRGATGRPTVSYARPVRQAVPKVKATLGDVAPGRHLTWHGNAGADWLFAGDREFLIDEQPDGTVLFTHVEDVHAALFALFRAVTGSAIQRSHDAFNAALNERAEGGALQQGPSPPLTQTLKLHRTAPASHAERTRNGRHIALPLGTRASVIPAVSSLPQCASIRSAP